MGSRFFTPNSIPTLGKVYVDKQKLLNSALTWFILDINIGAFIGGLVFSIVALKYGWEIGFLLGTISNALAFLFLRLAKYKNTIQLFDKPLNLPFISPKYCQSFFYLVCFGSFLVQQVLIPTLTLTNLQPCPNSIMVQIYTFTPP